MRQMLSRASPTKVQYIYQIQEKISKSESTVFKQTQLQITYDGTALFLRFCGQSKSGHVAF